MGSPKAPPAPPPVDPGKSALEYITSMADPALQQKILGAEQQFRPEYTKLTLQELYDYAFGIPGSKQQIDAEVNKLKETLGRDPTAEEVAKITSAARTPGTLDMLGETTKILSGIDAEANTALRTAEIADIEKLGPRAREAFRANNKEAFEALSKASELSGKTDFYKDLETAMANRRIFGDIEISPTETALIGGMDPLNLGGYAAERSIAPMLGAAPTAEAALLGAAPTISATGYSAEGYDAARAARVADVAAREIGQGELGASLYGQALTAAPTAASDTFRRRAAEMALSTGQLSPDELRAAQQSTREAFAARGLEMSNQAIAAEAMSRADAVRQRQAQDIQQAAALNQAYLADLNTSRGFATGVYGQDLTRMSTNQEAALRAALANQATGKELSLADQIALNQASQFGASARNEASQFGANAKNVAAAANAEMMARYAMANQEATNAMNLANVNRTADFLKSNQLVGLESNLANMNAANAAAAFTAEQANKGKMTGFEAEAARRAANAAALNEMASVNKANEMAIKRYNQDFAASRQDKGLADLAALADSKLKERGLNQASVLDVANAYSGLSFDPMLAILGRSSTAPRAAANERSAVADIVKTMGGNVFDTDAGVNIALQNAANKGNYDASVYASKSAMYGNIIGSALSGVGSALGGGFNPLDMLKNTGQKTGGTCWVAREVYGETNPRWIQFREWLMVKAPSWFRKLYIKYGEGFAAWIKNKPRIKNLIRKWMDSRINNYLFS